MMGLVYSVLLTVFLSVMIDGKLDDHFDKHHSTIVGTGNPIIEERKALHGHDEDIYGAKMYRTLFKVKHREQLNAMKNLLVMDAKKRHKLVLDLVNSIIKVLNNAKRVIDRANFTAKDVFPNEEKHELRDAIGNVVENTAFYSNLILHFPTILLNGYKKDMDWQNLFAWAFNFTTTARLHDDAADKLLDLAGQQLDIIPRREDFYNPYDKKAIKEAVEREALRKMEEAKRKKQEERKLERKKNKTKKPSLSRIEL